MQLSCLLIVTAATAASAATTKKPCTTYTTITVQPPGPTTIVFAATKTSLTGVDCGGCGAVSTATVTALPTGVVKDVLTNPLPTVLRRTGTTTVTRASCLPTPPVTANPCELVDCRSGLVCVVDDAGMPKCIDPPPAAAGPKCGGTTCPSGQECCNASCGMCVPPGWSCIQIACA